MVCDRPLSAPYSSSVPCKPCPSAAQILEGQSLAELHGFHVFSTVVAVDDAFRRRDLFIRDAILVIASVRPMHHKAPDPAGPEVEAVRLDAQDVSDR